ncbi:hypothetical protein ABW19_dt0209278 [Dactylella cylindrospora]|nr:hypothetical protein ABW19_dt0209278 [Dactylella cylindrospora]
MSMCMFLSYQMVWTIDIETILSDVKKKNNEDFLLLDNKNSISSNWQEVARSRFNLSNAFSQEIFKLKVLCLFEMVVSRRACRSFKYHATIRSSSHLASQKFLVQRRGISCIVFPCAHTQAVSNEKEKCH